MIVILGLTYDKYKNAYLYKGKSYKKIKTIAAALNDDGLSYEEAIKQIQSLKKTCK